MNSPDIKQFIREHSELFWYTPEEKKEEISHELLVETILNYGRMEDIKMLIKIMRVDTISDIISGMSGRKKLNIYPEILNYMTLILKRYASRNI